jgi:hypothetical protein
MEIITKRCHTVEKRLGENGTFCFIIKMVKKAARLERRSEKKFYKRLDKS